MSSGGGGRCCRVVVVVLAGAWRVCGLWGAEVTAGGDGREGGDVATSAHDGQGLQREYMLFSPHLNSVADCIGRTRKCSRRADVDGDGTACYSGSYRRGRKYIYQPGGSDIVLLSLNVDADLVS